MPDGEAIRRLAAPEPSEHPPIDPGYRDIIEATRVPRGARRADVPVARRKCAACAAMTSDPLEREADRIAERVVGSAAAPLAGPAAPVPRGTVQRKCAACEEQDHAQFRERAQPTPRPDAAGGAAPPALAELRTSGGQPLDGHLQAYFGPRFGRDFGDVRLHVGGRADASARAMDALAYTAGRDIVMRSDQYAPDTHAGHLLLAHELAHVVQQDGASAAPVQRKPDVGAAPASPAAAAPQALPAAAALPGPRIEIIKTLGGVELAEDEAFMRQQLRRRVAADGIAAPGAFVMALEADVQRDELAGDRAFKKQYEENPSAVAAGVPLPDEVFEAYDRTKAKEARVLELVRRLVPVMEQEDRKFLADFELQAKANARKALDASELEVKSEAIRYGIQWKAIQVPVSDCLAGDCVYTRIAPRMRGGSPQLTGLQAAAKLLLERRSEIDRARQDLDIAVIARASRSFVPPLPGEDRDAEVRAAQKTLDEKIAVYNALRGYLSAEYPILAAVSEVDKSRGALEDLVQRKAGPEMAALLGEQIVDRLTKIQKVRRGLDNPDDVNIWRLPRVVELTAAQLDVDADPANQTLIAKKIDAEKNPGFFGEIALFILNIAALALAGVTGGLSLAVAAGVNAAVAAVHVQDYLMQSALAGTAFDRAKALSQDEPSLLWLAVEIVGVGLDVGAAAAAASKAIGTFRKLGPLVKAAEEAQKSGDAIRAKNALAALHDAAMAEGGANLAQRVTSRVSALEQGPEAALKALGATEKEVKTLATAAQASEEELKAGVMAEVRTSKGSVKVTRSGNICVAQSPCAYLRNKYRALAAADPEVEAELAALEDKGLKVMEEVDRAIASNDPRAKELLAKAFVEEDKVARQAAAFDEKLGKMVAHRDAVAKLGHVDAGTLQKLARLDADTIERLARLDADTLRRLADLPEEVLRGLRQVDDAGLRALASDADTLKNLRAAREVKNPTVRVGSREPWTGAGKAPQWSDWRAKAYRHVVAEHGADRLKPRYRHEVLDRMRNSKQAQGIWRDNQLIVEAERLAPPFEGQYIIDMGKDVGTVFELDGTVTESVTRAFVRRHADGTLLSAYPISGHFTGLAP